MPNITIKPINTDQLLAVLKLISELNDTFLIKYLGYLPDLADLQKQTFNDPDFDPKLFLGAFSGDTLVGCIHCVYRKQVEDMKGLGFVKWIYVKKEHRKQNIGKQLLTACEKHLLSYDTTELQYGACSPLYLFPGIPSEEVGTADLLKSCGWEYKSDRISICTELDKCGITQQILDELLTGYTNVTLEIAGKESETEVIEFTAKNFYKSWAQEVLPCFHDEPQAYCSVLREAGRIAGYATLNGTNPNRFGPMGVSEEYRKKGYGKLLFFHSLIHAQKIGMKHVIINWINGKEDFYGRYLKQKEWLTFNFFSKKIS